MQPSTGPSEWNGIQRAGRGGTDAGQSIEFRLPRQAVAWLLTDLSCSNFTTNEAEKGRHLPTTRKSEVVGLVIRKTRNLVAAGGMTWPISTRRRSHAAS